MDMFIVLLPRLVYVELYFCLGAEHPDALCQAVQEPLRFKRGISWALQAEATNGAEMKPFGLAARCPAFNAIPCAVGLCPAAVARLDLLLA